MDQSTLIRYVHQRIKNNKNFLCVITGPTGSGKSYSALKLAEILDPTFNINRVAFKAIEFMRILSTEPEAGSVIVFDEAGVEMNSRNWQTKINKVINYVLQTFRHRNYIVIFTSPHFGFVDKASRQLFHAHFETVSINRDEKTSLLKPKFVQVNQDSGKIYKKYLRVSSRYGFSPINKLKLRLASKKLLADYESKKMEFTQNLNMEILEDLEESIMEPKKLTEKQERIVELLRNKYTAVEVSKEMNIHLTVVYDNIRQIRKKGWKIRPVRAKDERRLSFVSHYEVEESEKFS